MPTDNLVDRGDVQALVPEEVSELMLENIVNDSAALTLFRRVPIGSNQLRMPVLTALPMAYFVNGDTGLKQTTELAWKNKYLNVEEIAAIVPIPEAVVDDLSLDVFENVRPAMEDAVARTLDAAIFFGADKPASWPASIVAGATAAGNLVARGTSTPAEGGVAEDINLLFATVEDDGYDVTGAIARSTMRAAARAIRNTTGDRTLDVTAQQWWGVGPVLYPMSGLWPVDPGAVDSIAGDFNRGLLGVRRDVTYKVLDQAVITDANGAVVYNLAQQDMLALRVVARYAFEIANPINYANVENPQRYPFAIMTSPTGS